MSDLLKRAGELADTGYPDEAMDICNQLLLANADDYKALFVAGSVSMHAARYVQAIQLLKRVTELMPRDHRAYGQLGLAFGEIHQYDDSIRYTEKALGLRREAKTLADAAYANINAGNWDKGAEFNRQALALKPDLLEAKVHAANIALAQGKWAEGFAGFRHTLRTKFRKEYSYGEGTQEWQGEPDAVVAVTGEQGIGDEIMAASVIPQAIRSCKRFVFDCDDRLAALFQRAFPTAVISPTRRSKALTTPVMPTHHKSLFGLCELFRHKDEDFPRTAYLKPNAEYVRMFKSLLGRPMIGIAWSGGLPRTGLEQRTAGLNAFLPLIRAGGADFVSLQYKDDAAEIAAFESQYGLRVKRLPWVTQGKDMDLIAGLLAACDEVVGVHTAALHLSSALGVPTTTITHRGSGWRYAPDELLWYPSTTVMHKKRAGESWRECIARLPDKERIAA